MQISVFDLLLITFKSMLLINGWELGLCFLDSKNVLIVLMLNGGITNGGFRIFGWCFRLFISILLMVCFDLLCCMVGIYFYLLARSVCA